MSAFANACAGPWADPKKCHTPVAKSHKTHAKKRSRFGIGRALNSGARMATTASHLSMIGSMMGGKKKRKYRKRRKSRKKRKSKTRKRRRRSRK